jgi:preprotein translocase subunit SecG
MIHELIIIFHIFLCAGIIGLVLIQHGKGADAGAAFGSGASATVFGSQGSASFLTKTTAILATTFFITSLTLAYFSTQKIEPKSVVEKEQATVTLPTSEIPGAEVPGEAVTDNDKETSPTIPNTSDPAIPSDNNLQLPEIPQ